MCFKIRMFKVRILALRACACAAQGRSCAIAVAVAPLPRRCRCAVAFGAPMVAPRVDYRNIQVPDPAPLPLRRCVWRADGFSRSRLPDLKGEEVCRGPAEALHPKGVVVQVSVF